MSEWQERYMKDVVDIRVSNVDKKIHPNKSLVKLCNYMDAYSNNYITSKIAFSIGSADVNEIQRFGLKIDDVVITKDSETPEDIAVSSVVIEELENDVVCGYHLAILRPDKNELYGKFLMLKLKQPELKNYFYSVANGSTRYGLTIGNVESAKINYPPLPTQRKIARILATVDAVIENTQAAIAKYKAIKQGMLHDLFTRGIDSATGKLRPKHQDAPHFYRQSRLDWIPKEWECETTESLLYMKGRIGWQGLKANEFLEYGNYLVTGIHFNKRNRVDWPKCYRINDDRYNQAPEIQLREADVLITKDGTIGKIAYIDRLPGNASLNSHLLVLRPISTNLISKFLFYSLMSLRFTRFIDNIKTGSTLAGLTQSNFGKYYLILPPMEEQKQITALLEALEDKIFNEEDLQLKYKQLKAGLMADLLSGKKKVTVDEEPAN
jgi:type I restriction enzyme S subunit